MKDFKKGDRFKFVSNQGETYVLECQSVEGQRIKAVLVDNKGNCTNLQVPVNLDTDWGKIVDYIP